jgi:dTDP-L-rhamnose 4-epimerase
MSDRILVTGGAGFIGSFLVDALVETAHNVTVLDNLEEQVHGKQRPDYLNPNARYLWDDVRDYDALKKAVLDARVIFHFAAMVGVGQSQYQIRRYVDANILGTANLLDILANNPHPCEKLIVAASMSSYGEGLYSCMQDGLVRPPLRSERQMQVMDWELHCPVCGRHVKPVPTPETAQQHCNSIYAITKKTQEEMVMVFGRTYGLATVALRFFNVYGPRQSLSNPYTGVAAIFLSRIKNDQPPVVYEDGMQTRDFVSVHDVVQASLLAMHKPQADNQVFNVASGSAITIGEMARQLAQLQRRPIRPQTTHRFRKGDVRHCIADITKIQDRLGYQPRVQFADGMQELIQWSREAEAVDRFQEASHALASHGLA